MLLNGSANIASKEAVALPSLPVEPNQPSSFPFSKCSFGKMKPVLCAAKPQWFKSWKFLHYDEARVVVFCHVCVTAFRLGRIKSSHNASPAFVSTWSRYYLLQMYRTKSRLLLMCEFLCFVGCLNFCHR